MSSRGLFITFEGIDGCGKSTQIARAAAHLFRASYGAEINSVLVTREPTDPNIKRKLNNAQCSLEGLCEAFVLDRADHAQNIVGLLSTMHVLCDRYADSTYAYQCAMGLEPDTVKQLHKKHNVGLAPDLTLLLDIAPELAAQRMGERAKDATDKNIQLQHTVRGRYLQIANKRPDRIVVIDASGTPEQVETKIRAAINAALERAKC
jgi:dTMP kinase